MSHPLESSSTASPSAAFVASRARRWLARHRWWPLLVVGVVVFLSMVWRFRDPQTGFTDLVLIGDQVTPTSRLLATHPYVYKDSSGYDGQAYVQIALDPLLTDPQLESGVDSLRYRARRILVPALSWLAGLGRPGWIVQAYALSNVAGWLLLGLVLLRWLPPTDWQNAFRWSAIMFSHGLCISIRYSVTDGPGLALLALGIALLERKRSSGAVAGFAAAVLSRETYGLQVAAALAPAESRRRGDWLRAAKLIALAAAPLLVWMLYVQLHTSDLEAGSSRNFALPGAGYLGRWREFFHDASGGRGWIDFMIVALLTHIALTVQFLVVALRRRPADAWWRAGAAAAALGLVLGPAVWEGYPGAAMRVLLPMTVAFNLLLPRGGRWIPLLVLGNLSIVGGPRELADVPLRFNQWAGERGAVYDTLLDVGGGWYPVEANAAHTWRWCRDRGELCFTNRGSAPVKVRLAGRVVTANTRSVSLLDAGRVIWSSGRFTRYLPFRTGEITIPPGRHVITFVSDQPPVAASATDSRLVSFGVYDLTLTAEPAGKSD